MFEGKTLLALGCSHVFGEYEGDINAETCHPRSWVKKLERLGNFKNSINLGMPGGSNNRSERVLIEYLNNNDTKDLVVIFSITELSRIEFLYKLHEKAIDFLNVGSWMLTLKSNDPEAIKDVNAMPERVQQFLETYYVHFQDNRHDRDVINRRIAMLHGLLKLMSIEHYFFEMICHPGTVKEQQLGFNIPLIKFKNREGFNINANNMLHFSGMKPGKCSHWDHDGNEFLAEYLLKYIKEHYYD